MSAKSFAALLAVALSLGFAPVADADDSGSGRLTVMTRNLYVGSSFSHAVTAASPAEFVQGVSTIWSNVRHSDFRTRAKAIAREIAVHRPHLVGLQEVSLWERAAGSEQLQVSADYLEILLGELHARGLSYAPAAVSTGFVVAAPAFEEGRPITLRLTDRDAILVRTDAPGLELSDGRSAAFAARVTLPTVVGPFPAPRTWNLVDGSFRGMPFRVVNTHLEPDFPGIQVAQAQELLAGPLTTGRALIAIGDFNSAADGSGTASYGLLTAGALNDAWDDGSGFTCCQAELLDNPTSRLNERIDLVLAGQGAEAKELERIGDRTKDRIGGLWPSDHAGVVAELKLRDEN